jgi:hypothetical protein
MSSPGFRIFRLSTLDKEQEARRLALGRAVVALGRKVLTDNPRPDIPRVALRGIKKPFPSQPDGGRMALDSATKANQDLQSLHR